MSQTSPESRVDEIADGIYRISTYVPEIAPPAGFTFNQFLIDAEEPLLFHTGPRRMFPLVREAVAKVVPVERLRWIGFGHFEADECGSMNEWLQVAPDSQVLCGSLAAMLSIEDTAIRPPHVVENGGVVDLGGKRVRQIDTPHVPHNWEAQLLYEETTGTLLCGDLFTQVGNDAPLVETDIVGPAIETEHIFNGSSLSPAMAPTMRRLAELEPDTLGLMHGSSFRGDGGGALRDLADAYEDLVAKALADTGQPIV